MCGKLLESIIRDEIMGHLTRNKLLRDSQHRFMNRKSCCTNVLEFFEKETRAMDDGVHYDMVLLDLDL